MTPKYPLVHFIPCLMSLLRRILTWALLESFQFVMQTEYVVINLHDENSNSFSLFFLFIEAISSVILFLLQVEIKNRASLPFPPCFFSHFNAQKEFMQITQWCKWKWRWWKCKKRENSLHFMSFALYIMWIPFYFAECVS